jgi:hypothetical protein
MARPTSGLSTAETRKPKEKAPATTCRRQPNSSTSGGGGSEKAVRVVMSTPMVTKATATITQP